MLSNNFFSNFILLGTIIAIILWKLNVAGSAKQHQFHNLIFTMILMLARYQSILFK